MCLKSPLVKFHLLKRLRKQVYILPSRYKHIFRPYKKGSVKVNYTS